MIEAFNSLAISDPETWFYSVCAAWVAIELTLFLFVFIARVRECRTPDKYKLLAAESRAWMLNSSGRADKLRNGQPENYRGKK